MSGWKKGPLPVGTWQWGGVVLVETPGSGEGVRPFHFADFCGDHVTLPMRNNRRIEPHEIEFWNNSLQEPIVVDESDELPKPSKSGKSGKSDKPSK